jgi:non-ribosomal peptide synthetase component F
MDRPQPAMSSRRGGLFTLILSAEMTAKLVELSRREGVTLFMLLLAAFKIMLHRYTGRDDITVGTDIANRNRSETENLIGFFVNQLALRTNLNGNPTFRELLGRVRGVTLAAYAHQDLPFEKIVEVLRPDRSLNQAPLFQVKVVMDNTPMERLNLPKMKFEPFGITTDGAKYSLTLTMVNAHEGLRCVFNYDLDWFGDGVGEMAYYFEALLNQVVTSVDVTVNELKAKLEEVDKEQWRLKEKELHEVELLMFRRSRRKVTSQPV